MVGYSVHKVCRGIVLSSVSMICFLITGCATSPQPLDTGQPDAMQQLALDGITQIKHGQFVQARETFSKGLRVDPRNCGLNTLNALSYQLQGRSNDVALLGLAMAGYKTAIRFCPNDPWPYYYSGVASLQTKHYVAADKNFQTAARLLQDSNGDHDLTALYRAYLYSAYKSGDIQSGQEALAQLEKLAPNSPMIKPLKDLYSSLDMSKVDKDNSKAPTDDTTEDNPHKQVLVDAVLILSKEASSHKQGINLLDSLSLTLNGTGSNSNTYDTATSPWGAWESTSTYGWSLSLDEVQYDMNIFNTVTEQDQILARPTIMVADGKEANYFVGNDLYLGLSGSDYGSFEEVPLGLALKVTPNFNDDGTIQLTADISRELLVVTSSEAAGFEESAESVKQSSSSTVTLHYDETAVMGTLSEADEGEGQNRTPVLGRIPVLGNLFNRHEKEQVSTTLLILLTPRRYVSFKTKHMVPPAKAMQNYYMGLVSPATNLKQTMRWLRVLDIYYRPERLTPDLYDKKTLNRSLTDEYSIEGGESRDLTRLLGSP